MVKTLKWLGLLLLVCLLIAVIVLRVLPSMASFWWVNGKSGLKITKSISSENEESDPAVTVEVAYLRRTSLKMTASGSGIANAVHDSEVSSDVSGKVVVLNVAEGDHVKKGELLLQLDDRTYQLALEEAESQLLIAQLEFGLRTRRNSMKNQRTNGTNAIGDTSMGNANGTFKELDLGLASSEPSRKTFTSPQLKSDIERIFSGKLRHRVAAAKSGLSRSLVALRKAEMDLQATRLRAPFSGVIADLNVSVGERISIGEPILRLIDTSRILLKVQVLETEFGDIRVGQPVSVRFVAYPTHRFSGEVIAVNPAIDPEKKTGRVTVGINNPEGTISVGMSADVAIESRVFTNRLLVPKAAIIERDGRSLVFIVREGLAKWCYVDIGLSNLSTVEIVGSSMEIKEGEPVIVNGHFTLPHDANVKLKTPDA